MQSLMQYSSIKSVSSAQSLVCGYILFEAESKLNLWIPAEIVVFIINYFNVTVTAKDFKVERILVPDYETKSLKVSREVNGEKRLFTMQLIDKGKHKKSHIRGWCRRLMRQYKFLHNLELHPFINPIYNAWQTKSYLIITRDYYYGGDLHVHLRSNRTFGRKAPDAVRIWVSQLILAIEHLHSNDIINIDLLLENLSLDEQGNICITTLDTRDDESLQSDSIGYRHVEYLSPEIVQNTEVTKATDWWTLGIVMYELLVGIPPFYSQNVNEQYRKIQEMTPIFPPWTSDQANDLMVKLLNKDYKNRIGYNEIIGHEYFDGLDWDKVYRKKVEIDYCVEYKHKNLMDYWQYSESSFLPPFDGQKWYETLMSETVISRDDDFPKFKTIPPLFVSHDIKYSLE